MLILDLVSLARTSCINIFLTNRGRSSDVSISGVRDFSRSF